MQVLHAVWDKEGLYLWAESSALPLSAPGHRGRKPEKPKARAHPFALAGDELKEVVRSICDQTFLKQTFLKFETKTFLLPSIPKGPLPSPWLIREEDYSAEKATGLAGWDIETLTFEDPYSAFDFLLGLPEPSPRGIAFGSSLRFWIEVARFALELITRQQFVPAIKAGKQDFRATWEAVITEEDEERVRMLAEAMPPSCRAFPDKDKSQMLSPADIVLSFINRTVDRFIRKSLDSISLLPPRRGRRPKVVPLPEQWLQVISTDNPVLVAPPEELNSFSTEMQAWLAQLQPAAPGAPFRTCFRLDPPSYSDDEENGEEWKVRFFLQAKDDLSLLIPAEEVWKTRSSMLTFLKRRFENPQEQLLADLGKASRAFSAIELSLQTARPVGLELNAEQAYSFLRQSAPLLEQSGFGVLLPSWWEKPGARIGVKLRLKPALDESGKVVTSGLLGVKGIIAYDWTVAIGDETLSEDEFEQLACLKVPLVWVRGQWVELRQEDIETAIDFFKKKHGSGSGEMTLGEAMQLGLGGGVEDVETEVGLPVVEVETEGWLEDMLSSLSEGLKITNVKTPRTFRGTLRPYQIKGVSWLAYLSRFGLGACLADDMGLGKCVSRDTLIVINGMLQTAEDIWNRYAEETIFDGEGFWAVPTETLRTNSLDSETGEIVQSCIQRLYRQHVHEHLRNVHLEDGSSVTITYRHKLLTNKGWTNDLHKGDYVCVPARIIWDGKSEDPDLVKFLAWQIAEGYEPRKQAMLSITQKDTERLDDLRQIILHISRKYKIKINCPAIRTFTNKTPALVINSREYERFLSDKGYCWGRQSRGKSIPPFIMQADLDSARVFLRNYFDAEGSVIQSMRSIEISTASAMLIHTQLDKQLLSTTKTRLQQLLDSEVYYCKIKKIEEVQYDGWVYDFEVEEHHNFIANNILCHNTIELITLLLHERSGKRGQKPAPTLLICPMSVVGNWQKEVERFAPSLKVMVHHGADRHTGKIFAREAKKNDLVISTYALAHRDEVTLSTVQWQHVVLDEAQNIKNPSAKQTQAIKKLEAEHRIALTGTPVENRLSELWSIMDFLNPGYLKSAQHFRTNFALPIEKYRKNERAEILRRIIQPFVLRRVKTDPKIIKDLPEKMEMNVYYNLTHEQASLYEAVVAEMIERIEELDRTEESEGIERKGLVLATLLKLKQICNHPALFLQDGSVLEGRSGKLARLEEMLEEVLAAGDKALIFTQFAGMGVMLRHYLQEMLGCETLFLHGGTPKKQRDAMILRFQNDHYGPPLFILSLKAGGFGLNLTAANHVFHFDRWWNPAVENQATDRVFRIGQTKNVLVHKFVCIGTLEERIDQMIEQKKALAESIIGAGEAWLTELSTEQLKEVFALSRDAVEPLE